MKIATWNVNSLRVRLPQVQSWLARERPAVLAIQETKLHDAVFPTQELLELGYHSLASGQPTYNGVAILSVAPPHAPQIGIPGMADPQRRALAASYLVPALPGGALRVINLYVPNGQEVGSAKYAYKLAWLAAVRDWIAKEIAAYPNIAVLGDYNIAPEDQDVHDPRAWRGCVAVSTAERAAFRELLALGLHDAFRLFPQAARSFSWWDYRAQAFPRNLGLRIDHILFSSTLIKYCVNCWIARAVRAAPRPSDHAPVIAELNCETNL